MAGRAMSYSVKTVICRTGVESFQSCQLIFENYNKLPAFEVSINIGGQRDQVRDPLQA